MFRAITRHPLPEFESNVDISTHLQTCTGLTACGMEVSNYSKFRLTKHQLFLKSGEVLLDPGTIKPGYRGTGIIQDGETSEG